MLSERLGEGLQNLLDQFDSDARFKNKKMPLVISSHISKKHIPDREMILQLTGEELKRFLENFPEFNNLHIDAYEPPQIKVTVTVSAFLKKPTDAVKEKD